MAVIYPQIAEASNPAITITTPREVATTPDGTQITRSGLESFFDAAGRKGGIMGTVLGMPQIQQQFRDKIFGPEAELVEYNPNPRVPLTPPSTYEPGMDPMFNYFEGQEPPSAVIMKEGSKGLVGDAERVQRKGRNGDTMLVHMNPDEFNAMAALGGLGGLAQNRVTINPDTGLPEMFSFRNILPTVVGIAGAAFGVPTLPLALGVGATTAVTTGDLGKGILAGLGSYALGSLFGDVGASGVPDAAATQAAGGNAFNVGGGVGQISSAGGAGLAAQSANAATPVAGGVVGPPTFTQAVGQIPNPLPSPASSGLSVGGGFENIAVPPVSVSPVASPQLTPEALSAARTSVFENAPFSTALDSTATGPSRIDYFTEGLSKIGQPGGVSYVDAATKGLGGLGASAAGAGLLDAPTYDYTALSDSGRSRNVEPIAPLRRNLLSPGPDYRPGFDPAFSYFAQDGKRGELDPSMGGIMGSPAVNPIMQSAQQIASNAMPQQQMNRLNPAMYNPNAAIRASLPMRRMANGSVPEDQAMAGLMDVASDEVKNNLDERMSVPPQDSEPQNVEERIVYDNAMLAVQGVLQDEAAQEAVSEFIETFGMAAYEALVASVNEPRDEGGVIKPANGQTTVKEGAIQGEDVIAGMIVDPETGEETANLRIGENEYVEPAESLVRRAMAAGLPPTPKNGAMVRSAEEDQLRMIYG